jgi:predicted small secreted protein
MRKRFLLFTALFILTMTLLAGCGGGSKGLEGAAAKAKLVLHENKNLQTVEVKTPGQKAPWLKEYQG